MTDSFQTSIRVVSTSTPDAPHTASDAARIENFHRLKGHSDFLEVQAAVAKRIAEWNQQIYICEPAEGLCDIWVNTWEDEANRKRSNCTECLQFIHTYGSMCDIQVIDGRAKLTSILWNEDDLSHHNEYRPVVQRMRIAIESCVDIHGYLNPWVQSLGVEQNTGEKSFTEVTSAKEVPERRKSYVFRHLYGKISQELFDKIGVVAQSVIYDPVEKRRAATNLEAIGLRAVQRDVAFNALIAVAAQNESSLQRAKTLVASKAISGAERIEGSLDWVIKAYNLIKQHGLKEDIKKYWASPDVKCDAPTGIAMHRLEAVLYYITKGVHRSFMAFSGSSTGRLLRMLDENTSVEAIQRVMAENFDSTVHKITSSEISEDRLIRQMGFLKEDGFYDCFHRRIVKQGELNAAWRAPAQAKVELPEHDPLVAMMLKKREEKQRAESNKDAMAVRRGAMSFQQFVRELLPLAVEIDALPQTAVFPSAFSTSIKTDGKSVYQWGGHVCPFRLNQRIGIEQMGLKAGTWVKVTEINTPPWLEHGMWFVHESNNPMAQRLGDFIHLGLAGVVWPVTFELPSQIFTSHMRSELESCHDLIDQTSRELKLANANDSDALFGIAIGVDPVRLRVKTQQGDYVIADINTRF